MLQTLQYVHKLLQFMVQYLLKTSVLLTFLLCGQQTEPLLRCKPLFTELVVRTESRWVCAHAGGAVLILLLQRIISLAIGVNEIH